MDNFDPDAYLADNAQGQQGGFDPDAYLASNAPQPSATEAAARGALRNFPGAQQLAAAAAPINPMSDKPTYSAELQHLTDAAEAGKAAHPVAYGAGAVAGSLAPLAIPGAGEVMEAAPILSNAGLGAAQALSDTSLTKNPGKAAGEAAVGGALGAGAGAIGKFVQGLAPTEKTLAAEATGQGTGATMRRLSSSGLLRGDDPQGQLAEMGQWLNSKGAIKWNSRPEDILGVVSEVKDSAGKTIGQAIERLDTKELPVAAGRLTSGLKALAEETIDPQSEAKLLKVADRLGTLDKSDRLDFSALNKLKGLVGEQAGKADADPAMKRAYGIFSDYMDTVLESYGQLIKKPATKAAYDAAKIDYRHASQVEPLIRYALARQDMQGVLGNSGLLGMFGLASGVAGGHPIAGIGSMGASSVLRPIANRLGSNLALKAVPVMPQIAAAGRGLNKIGSVEATNLADYLESKYGKHGTP